MGKRLRKGTFPKERAEEGALHDSVPNLYSAALDEAERALLEAAAQRSGLADEIALLRVRLLRVLEKSPENYALLLRAVEQLTRAVSVQYRLSPQAQADLERSLAVWLNQFRLQLWPVPDPPRADEGPILGPDEVGIEGPAESSGPATGSGHCDGSPAGTRG